MNPIIYPDFPACELQNLPVYQPFWFTYADIRELFELVTGPDAPTKLHFDGTPMYSVTRIRDGFLVFLKSTDIVKPTVFIVQPTEMVLP